MKLYVRRSEIGGTLSASPSKSYTHRAMVLGLLGKGTSKLDNVLLGGDTLATLGAVRKLGGTVTFEGDRCVIDGGHLECPDDVIDTENSGTTIRIIAGIASLALWQPPTPNSMFDWPEPIHTSPINTSSNSILFLPLIVS